jgi:hypothetical protein
VQQHHQLNRHQQRASAQRGQSTIEFALVLPLFVLCASVLVSILVAGLITLRLNDYARVAARTIAASQDSEEVRQDMMKQCGCKIDVSVKNDIVSVRADKPFAIPVVGFQLPIFQLRGDSFAMKEPVIVFRAPSG